MTKRVNYEALPVVDEGIAIPERNEHLRRYYDFGRLKPGQSMFFPLTRSTVNFHLRKWRKRHSSKWTFKSANAVRRDDNGVATHGTRVWRRS